MYVAVIGSGDTTEALAESLMRDFVTASGYIYVVFPEQEDDPDGMQNAYHACETLEDEQLIWLSTFDDFDIEFIDVEDLRILFVLGTDGVEGKISKCHENNIPVFDMTRAMYPVTGV